MEILHRILKAAIDGAFGDWMQSVPDHVQVVIQPGNHDASRPAEPQLRLCAPAYLRPISLN